MEGGTLLGAVKYQGFVPWDDDIDVIMRREDYEIFLKVAPQELNNAYFLQSYNNVAQFPLNYAKLCYKNSYIKDYSYSHIKDMMHGVFIDIFPIDNVDIKKFKNHCSQVGLLTGARKVKLKLGLGSAPKWKKLCYKALSLLPLTWLNSMVNKVCTRYNKKNTGYRYEICNPNKKFLPMPAELYNEYVELQFNDKTFMAVKDYDVFLKSRFGNDYMDTLPPIEERKPSHCQNIFFEVEDGE